jgi:site-specific DNA-methyltransferase (adenine-specific)
MPGSSVDSIVTDPPYGLSFMGKKWDYDVPSVELWQECLRVLKPGGHLLAFAGTRTQHRMAVRIEDAGFEIRDMIAWVYGSGFPKSLDVSKAIDKAAGVDREVVGPNPWADRGGLVRANTYGEPTRPPETSPATDAARQWQGWGTALKPAMEPITVARKPLIGTVAANVLEHGTGALNVDGCRIEHDADVDLTAIHRQQSEGTGIAVGKGFVGSMIGKEVPMYKPGGRWPANLIHDGSEEVTELLNDAARFFKCAKASKRDRDEGLEGFDLGNNMRVNGPRESEEAKYSTLRANIHPTVKPTDLMRYLCRLVTPPGGVVLDPFMGSGSTGKAAMLEGFRFIGCELSEEYFKIADARISAALASQPLL